MELAMLTMAVDQAENNGFIMTTTQPWCAQRLWQAQVLNAHADEIYRLREPDDSYLVGTSEAALAGMHADEIIDLSNGPCAMQVGRAATVAKLARRQGYDGIIRVHQFNKVGNVHICEAGRFSS